jgi:hypothetical protein
MQAVTGREAGTQAGRHGQAFRHSVSDSQTDKGRQAGRQAGAGELTGRGWRGSKCTLAGRDKLAGVQACLDGQAGSLVSRYWQAVKKL